MSKALNPRRYDRIDAALSFGLVLVGFWLLCLYIDKKVHKSAPPPVVADNAVKPWGVN